MKKYFYLLTIAFLAVQFTSCKPDVDEDDPEPDTSNAVGTPVKIIKPKGFPDPLIPKDNPLTEEGILLGRMLFYDPILSGDSSMSCSSCHKQEFAFGTDEAFSNGIHNTHGNRSSMPLFNLAWINYGFFWDGRSSSLEKQASEPVKNPLEMDLTWDEAVVRLQRHSQYPEHFKKAFGSEKVTEENATKAIAQFLRTIVSADSKFDKALRLYQTELNESELRGYQLYTGHPDKNGIGEFTGGGNCEHCHGDPMRFIMQPLDAAAAYRNNGLDSVKSRFDFKDFGYALTKPDTQNYGRFKAPSLRNIELTAPYMHDGRIKTLEEVIEHYNNGGHASPTLDAEMGRIQFAEYGGKLHLTEQDKKDLIAFLKTLTDRNLTTNPAYASPFK